MSEFDWNNLKKRIAKSKFRSRFKLKGKDLEYCLSRTRKVIQRHTQDFIIARLSPKKPENDGKQTPMQGHPVFPAQHATATCCRGCLEKWHGITRGKEMSGKEIEYAVAAVMAWIDDQLQQRNLDYSSVSTPDLFEEKS